MRCDALIVAIVGLGLLVAAGEATAQGFPGDGVLSGRAKLKVRGCGKGKSDVDVDGAVRADGTWSALDGTSVFAGTGAIGGRGGRRLTFALDAASTATLVERVAADAGTLCGQAVTATDLAARKAVLKVNGKRTRARLKLVYAGSGIASDGSSGKAKYRLVASGPWNGPLTCAEIVECRESCIGLGQFCVDACVARGTLATQGVVTSLFACLVGACPTGDLVCEQTALAGVCADELDACLGPPPPASDLTCEEIFDCRAECDPENASCPGDCLDRGTSRGRDEADAVLGCLATVCPTGDSNCLAVALAGSCAGLWERCTGTRPPTNLTCGQVLDCLATCPAGAAACESDCRGRGSTAAKLQVTALFTCIDTVCPTRDPRCVSDSVTGQCAPEWAACLG